MKKIIFIIATAIVGYISSPAQAGTITIANQYPSPVGIYDKLRLVPRALLTGPCDIGTFYVPTTLNTLYYCKDGITYTPLSSPWNQTGTNVYLVDPINNVGIGTPTPEFKLSLDIDGGILAKGVFGTGANLTTSGAGTRLIWYPKKAALRIGSVDGDQWNDANIGIYSSAIGHNNKVTGKHSNISGGHNNQILISSLMEGAVISGGISNIIYEGGIIATIAGGYNNQIGAAGNPISGLSSTIGGGRDNKARGTGSTVGGGENNQALGFRSTISGGLANTIEASNTISFIGGGSNHLIRNGVHNTIAGGDNNKIEAWRSTIAGGTFNHIDIDGSDSFVGGGTNNHAWGAYSTIGGGQNNVTGVSGDPLKNRNTVGGGFDNQATGIASFIGGGVNNRSTAQTSTVAGGNLNEANGINSSVLGGFRNFANGNNSTIPGGGNNIADGDSSLAAGEHMILDDTADRTFIWGHASSAITPVTTSDAFIIYSGNVGIGTTAPDQKLHVDGAVKLEPQSNPPLCDDARMGSLYVSGNGGLCFCNPGSALQQLNSKGTCP